MTGFASEGEEVAFSKSGMMAAPSQRWWISLANSLADPRDVRIRRRPVRAAQARTGGGVYAYKNARLTCMVNHTW